MGNVMMCAAARQNWVTGRCSEREREKLTATESTGWRSCACFANVICKKKKKKEKKNPPSHRCHEGVSSADFKLCPSVFLRVAPPQRALI